jgi:hypothetical protein
MLENSFYPNNNVDKQVFNACFGNSPTTSNNYVYAGNISNPTSGQIGKNTAGSTLYISNVDAIGNPTILPDIGDIITYGPNIGWDMVYVISVATLSATVYLINLNVSLGLLSYPVTSSTYSFSIIKQSWQTWTKPESRTIAYIVCIGGGAGGGGGAGAAATGNRGGGGGGGSSPVTIAQVPFYSIPDTLYIQVGLGGIGGLGGTVPTNGTPGGISFVSVYPSCVMSNTLLASAAPTAGGGVSGGGIGTTTTSGSGGGAGVPLSASSTTNPRYLSLCTWVSTIGQSGGNGGASAIGGNVLSNSSIITGGGAGGAGCTSTVSALGGYSATQDALTSWSRNQAPTISSIGNAGFSNLKPFLFSGGNGGGSVFNGTAFAGGAASIGSGGGGGGGGVTGGAGGNGGNGLVMIISY